jgi:hypothetical protein
MKKIIGIIGLGNISERHRKNLKLLYPDCELIVMSSSGKIKDLPIENCDLEVKNIECLIEKKPHFVLIASPASHHFLHASELLLSNIPVLIEKPITSSYKDAKKLKRIIETRNVPAAVGYCLRYLPSADVVKNLLESGAIGNIYNVCAMVGQFLPEWRPAINYKDSVSARKDLGGGVLLELSHELDYIRWFLGPLKLEYAQLRNSEELNLEVEEIADIVLTNKKGTLCNIHLDFLQKQAQRFCSFTGSKGRLDWNLLENNVVLYTKNETKIVYSDTDWDKNQMYIKLVEDFYAVCFSKKNYDSHKIDDAVETLGLIDEIKAKAIWGKVQ